MLVGLFECQPWKKPQFRPSADRRFAELYKSLNTELGDLAQAKFDDVGHYLSFSEEGEVRGIAIGEADWSSDFQPAGTTYAYDRSYGKIFRFDNGAIALESKFRNTFPNQPIIAVRWGARRYLLLDDEVSAFLDSVTRGEEPRTNAMGRFLMRVGDESVGVSGAPQLAFPPTVQP